MYILKLPTKMSSDSEISTFSATSSSHDEEISEIKDGDVKFIYSHCAPHEDQPLGLADTGDMYSNQEDQAEGFYKRFLFISFLNTAIITIALGCLDFTSVGEVFLQITLTYL